MQNEKKPGAHIAFGNPTASQTGADWTCSSYLDLITMKPDIWFDDVLVMARGEYLI